MIVDIGAYVGSIPTFLDGYIHYKSNVASSWISASNSFMQAKREQAIAKARSGGSAENQAQALMQSINNNKKQAKTTVDLAKEIAKGPALEQILQSVADQMNAALSANFGSQIQSFNSIRSDVQAFGNSKFKVNSKVFQGIDSFFDKLHQALELSSQKISDGEMANIQALQEIFNGTSSADAGSFITKDALTTGEKIVNYLATAARSLQGGSLTKDSFRGTISNIFSTAIGEPLAAQMMQAILQDIASHTNGIIIDQLAVVARANPNITLTGTSRYENNKGQKRTSKVDALGNNTFQLTVTYNEGDMQKTVTLELSSNLSIKWQQKASRSVHFVSGTSLPEALNAMGADASVTTAVYNVIAHRYSSNYGKGKDDIKKQSKKGDFYGAYNQIRGSVAANFFIDWLSGSGQVLEGTSGIDKAQFFMYNGKVYSVLTIVKNILANDQKLTTMAQFKGVTKIDNSFVGADIRDLGDTSMGQLNRTLAMERSNKVWQTINKITIAASLNINMLKDALP